MSPEMRALISICIAPVCLAALVSCQSTKETAEATASPDAIAEIYGQPVTAAQFSAYVAGITPSSADQTPEPNEAELMSRLLDRFLDEELILREAGRQGTAVTEREVTEALRRLQRPEGGEGGRLQETADTGAPLDAPAARERMRRALLVRKFREEKILNGLTVGPGEIGSWYDEHRNEFSQPAHMVLRQILLDDPAVAKRTRDDL